MMRGRRPLLQAIDGGVSDPPSAPAKLVPPVHLPAEMRTEWQTVCQDLRARGLLQDAVISVVDAYITALWAISECRKALARDGFFTLTKNSQPKPHPATGMLSKQTEIVVRLAAELGLTPSARQRKGMQAPDGESDDDASQLGL